MKTFYLILGILLMLGGVVAGAYFGIWWAFIGGIIDVINAFTAPTISATAVAFGVAKVVFAAAIGWATVFIVGGVGYAFLHASE